MPTDLEDALSQSRSLGAGFTLAHQYRRQLPSGLRSGIDANARNKIIFGLNAEDAQDLAKQAPQLESLDFILLPRFGIYTSLIQNGSQTGWFSARTLPPETPVREPISLRANSAHLYGRDASEVEADVLRKIGVTNPGSSELKEPDESIGRRPPGGSVQ